MKMHKGFYLKALRITGPNKVPAEVVFDKGLNILSGASNTGKSYIFQCINYLLGGETPPKQITEANGYYELKLQINTYDNKEFTLAREFAGKKIRFSETNIDNFDYKTAKEVNVRKGVVNGGISEFLLELIGLNGRKLRKDRFNVKKEISFRDLNKFCMINEQQIMSEDSPIYSGQIVTRTIEESLFNLILSGTDDESLTQLEDPKIYRQKIIGKLDFIQNSILRKTQELEKIKETVGSLEDEQINYKIEEFTNIVNNAYKLVLDEEIKRQKMWDKLESVRKEIGHVEELEKRFLLLKNHYMSDLDRLDFINEGEQYLNQVPERKCPICEKIMDKEIFGKTLKYNGDNIAMSVSSEVMKIKEKQLDLDETLKDLTNQKNELFSDFNDKTISFMKIDNEVKNKLQPTVDINRENLQRFLDFRTKKMNSLILESDIRDLTSEKDFFEAELKKKEKVGDKRAIPGNYYLLLQDEIGKILDDWKLGYNSVYYDKENNDLRLNGKLRKEFGKGYRALIRSAFMIGLLNYCLKNDKLHPFFLVLDSPLTTFKGKDTDKAEPEKLPEEIENKFFISLANICASKDLQIIIFENKEPKMLTRDTVNLCHFSGNPTIGRYGFYPKN
jgi:hypothetical protein